MKKKETRGGWNRKYKTDEERKRAKYSQTTAYHKRATTTISVKFHNENDKIILEKLNSVENKTDYLRQLILKDINKSTQTKDTAEQTKDTNTIKTNIRIVEGYPDWDFLPKAKKIRKY